MSSPPSITTEILRDVDHRLLRACCGAAVHIPTLNSRVYYFPQGHVEHCCAPSVISSFPSNTPPVPCIVSSVKLLADPSTDEVFAHLHLQPLPLEKFMQHNPSRFSSDNGQNNVITFTKVLSHSDANGGGFSVPRNCAESIFPTIDPNADPPVQYLKMTDMHGFVWEFRHKYLGSPRRHLLTSGWNKYVNSKKLISGNSVVFMKKSESELFIGVRRVPTSTSVPIGDEDRDLKKSFARIGKGKLTAQAVSEAIDRATNGQPFDVVYYPTLGWSEFVVKAEDVESSMTISWTPGTRVKMAIPGTRVKMAPMETEDSSQITRFQGTLACTHQSPWKKLQIKWDNNPELLPNMNKLINPWQVEVVAATPYTSPCTFPAGMQGDRHNAFGSFNPPQSTDFFSPLPGLGKVSTETNVGITPSDNLSLDSTSTNQSSGNDLVGNRSSISARATPFLLFGNVINGQEPPESGHVASGSNEEDGSKESSDNDDLNGTQLSLGYSPQSQRRI